MLGLVPLPADLRYLALVAAFSGAHAILQHSNVDLRTGPLDVFPVLAAGLRGGSRDDVVDSVLAKFAANPVRVTASFDPRWFALTSKDLSAVEAIRSTSATVDDHVGLSPDPKTVRRVLYLLAITSNLEREGSQDSSAGRLTLDSAPAMKTGSERQIA